MSGGDAAADPQARGDECLANIFFSPEGIADPTPWYRRLREESPVHVSASGAIFLTRYDDCRDALRDVRLGSGDREEPLIGADPAVAEFRRAAMARRDARPRSMLFLNPPEHTRQRGLVSRVFTPRRVEQMRADISALVEEQLDVLADAREADALDLVGFPVPVGVIGKLIGVPRADWPRFRHLVTTSAGALEPAASVDDLKAAGAAFEESWAYFEALVEERHASPQDDLLSDLLRVSDGDDTLSQAEVIATTLLIFAAGFETTTNLIGNGIGALFKNPEAQERLWSDPALVPSAVEEVLRWDSPVQLDGRMVLEPAEVVGHPVAVGTRVITLLGAANRDPEHFSDPDRFDITRSEGPPMSFGSGIHYCLGANLARVEGQEVFAGLIRRFRTVEPAADLVQRGRMTLRGYAAVPVRVTAR